ncbi:hypothetical protein AURDEDRAFT_171047 [Auricularia subglabra TFB-10046 SS5]|nr:hypothetical protein AURDEDRAFT_171047 [Auricularia subglabra TFB-10046 SS5]
MSVAESSLDAEDDVPNPGSIVEQIFEASTVPKPPEPRDDALGADIESNISDIGLRLLNPPQTRASIDDDGKENLLLSLRLFASHVNSLESAYTETIRACQHTHPDDDLLSLHNVKRWMERFTGVTPITHQRAQPARSPAIFLALQAMRHDPVISQQFDYGSTKLQRLVDESAANNGRINVLDDVLCGTELLDAYRDGRIRPTDVLLMLSYNGCQIYRDKQSDCWIYIWVVLSMAPEHRYKLHTGGFIPGPNKPKNFESFIFPGLRHIAAVNNLPGGGLPVWHAHTDRLVSQRLFVAFAGADGPAMTNLNGLVGHSGRLGCRYHCKMKGRRKPGQGGHHYPVMLLPTGNYDVDGCTHPDYAATELPPAFSSSYASSLEFVISSPNNTEYAHRRAATGISKPSILSGLGDAVLGVPRMCGGDIMHLVLNLSELLIPLWRGTFERAETDTESWDWAKLTGATWEQHGRDVAAATQYLPSSFDRAPRNPAEKINSGYKQWEYLLYIFGLCPGLLYGILPTNIWQSFCKLVRGIRLIYQHEVAFDDVLTAHKLFLEFITEFETMYYQRRADRIHFVRQSIHVLSDFAPEILHVGPGICTSQFPMERTIVAPTSSLLRFRTPTHLHVALLPRHSEYVLPHNLTSPGLSLWYDSAPMLAAAHQDADGLRSHRRGGPLPQSNHYSPPSPVDEAATAWGSHRQYRLQHRDRNLQQALTLPAPVTPTIDRMSPTLVPSRGTPPDTLCDDPSLVTLCYTPPNR